MRNPGHAPGLYLFLPCDHRTRQKGRTLSIDFESLVKLNGTLVFLMSISSMGMILDGLMNAGMPPEMPAAVLSGDYCASEKSDGYGGNIKRRGTGPGSARRPSSL